MTALDQLCYDCNQEVKAEDVKEVLNEYFYVNVCPGCAEKREA